MRQFALVLSVATLAVAGLAGCGGGDSDSTDTGGSDIDRAAVTELNQRVADLAEAGDAKRFCALITPSVLKENFKNAKACVKTVKPGMKSMSKASDFKIETLKIDGNVAVVTYADGQGTGSFQKENGRWYVGAPAPE